MTAQEVRVLTVRQPWAWAIVHGGKDVENRSRNLAGEYRGPVAIHVAGKYAEGSLDSEALEDAMLDYCDRQADHSRDEHPWLRNVGHIIGVVDLTDVHVGPEYGGGCHKLSSPLPVRPDYGACSSWGEARSYHLVLANPRPFTEPIPFKGGLGLRRLDAAFAARVLDGVRS